MLNSRVSSVDVTNKVILGFSGGVDSTAAALLLQEKGYDVIGVYLDTLDISAAEKQENINNAIRIADEIGIELRILNIASEFNEIVIKNFCEKYASGATPNPCIICNPHVKFNSLYKISLEENAYIATGHYAQITKIIGRYYIKRGANGKKDQSYVLYRLPQCILERLIFPLGEIEDKDVMRDMLKKRELSNYNKKDSQEICFMDNAEDRASFLLRNGYPIQPGNFIDACGKPCGHHKGISEYTIGQRKGLGISFGYPVFVTEIDPVKNTVKLDSECNLFKSKAICGNAYFPLSDSSKIPMNLKGEIVNLKGKIRYAAAPADVVCIDEMDEKHIKITFAVPQRALTPGQSIVLYIDDIIVGGAIIEESA